MKQNKQEQILTFSRTENLNFDKDGGYFQFANEEEVIKFQLFLKKLELDHEKELQSAFERGREVERKEIIKLVDSQIGRVPTGRGDMVIMGNGNSDEWQGKWIDRDLIVKALSKKGKNE